MNQEWLTKIRTKFQTKVPNKISKSSAGPLSTE